MSLSNGIPAQDRRKEKTVLTVDEAALYLGASRDTIYSMSHTPDGEDGSLPHFHLGAGGRSIRFYRALLDLWIINNSKGLVNRELMDFREAYMNNVGRKAIEHSRSEV